MHKVYLILLFCLCLTQCDKKEDKEIYFRGVKGRQLFLVTDFMVDYQIKLNDSMNYYLKVRDTVYRERYDSIFHKRREILNMLGDYRYELLKSLGGYQINMYEFRENNKTDCIEDFFLTNRKSNVSLNILIKIRSFSALTGKNELDELEYILFSNESVFKDKTFSQTYFENSNFHEVEQILTLMKLRILLCEASFYNKRIYTINPVAQ